MFPFILVIRSPVFFLVHPPPLHNTVVTQVRGSISGTFPPCPLRCVPCSFHRESNSAIFYLADSRRITPTRSTIRRSQQLIPLGIHTCAYNRSNARQDRISSRDPACPPTLQVKKYHSHRNYSRHISVSFYRYYMLHPFRRRFGLLCRRNSMLSGVSAGFGECTHCRKVVLTANTVVLSAGQYMECSLGRVSLAVLLLRQTAQHEPAQYITAAPI